MRLALRTSVSSATRNITANSWPPRPQRSSSPRGVTERPGRHGAHRRGKSRRSPSPWSSAISPPPRGNSMPGIHPARVRGSRCQAGSRPKSASKQARSSWQVSPSAMARTSARIVSFSTDASIGRDCRIMANVTVRERCILGDRVILQPGAVIGSDGYGYEFSDGRHVKIDQVGIVEIARRCGNRRQHHHRPRALRQDAYWRRHQNRQPRPDRPQRRHRQALPHRRRRPAFPAAAISGTMSPPPAKSGLLAM